MNYPPTGPQQPFQPQQPHGYPPQYQNPQQYRHPQQYPMRPPPKKAAAWPWVLLAVVLLGCGGFGILGLAGNSEPKSKADKTSTSVAAQPANGQPGAPSTEAPPADKKPKNGVAEAGSAVRDGQFEFVVTKVERGQTFLQDGYRKATAQGEFVLVSVKVTNTGKEQRTYWGDEQILIDDQDREFTASRDGNGAVPNNDSGYSHDLNPGFSIDRVVVFDIPPGTTFVAIEFHDSPFSRGVKVAL